MIPYLAAAVSALLLWAAFPPLGWEPLAFVAPVPFLWAVRRVERGVEALALGFLWGGLFFGILLSWIFVLGAVAWLPLVMLMATFFAVYAGVVWLFRLWPVWRWWLIAVGGWALLELVRGLFPFGGFPWGQIGFAAAGTTVVLGSVQWIGASGWTVLAVGFAAGLVLLIEDRSNWRFVVDTSVVIILLAVAGSIFPPQADGAVLRVAVVQGSTPCPRVHCQNEAMRIYESHLALTRSIPEGGADLVVWAENSTTAPYEPAGNEAVRTDIIAEAGRIGASFLVSGTRTVGDDEFVNVNVLFSPEGVEIGEYQKRHPVPFGEYVPLRGLLGFIPQLEQVPRDMIRGTDPVVFPIQDGLLGSVISFEGAFARSVRSIAREGSQVLVVATNESSFEVGPASDQLLGLTRVNAAAIGQDLVHAAISGKSAIVTASGEITAETGLFEETILYGRVQLRAAGPTLYTRWGDWLVYLAIVGMLFGLLWPGEGGLESVLGRRSRRH